MSTYWSDATKPLLIETPATHYAHDDYRKAQYDAITARRLWVDGKGMVTPPTESEINRIRARRDALPAYVKSSTHNAAAVVEVAEAGTHAIETKYTLCRVFRDEDSEQYVVFVEDLWPNGSSDLAAFSHHDTQHQAIEAAMQHAQSIADDKTGQVAVRIW